MKNPDPEMATNGFSFNEKLQLLIDKDEIRDLVFSYCQTVDRLDYDRFAQLYRADAKDNHGYNSDANLKDFLKELKTYSAASSGIHHIVANSYIRVRGDYAEAETYLMGNQTSPDGPGRKSDIMAGARYLDKFTKTDGVWMFSERVLCIDFARRFGDTTSAYDSAHIAPVTKGSTGPEDPSYKFFTLFKWGER
jgi:hypothetical protein